MVSHAPTPRGWGRSAPQILGFIAIYEYTFDAELPHFTWYYTWGWGLFLGVSHAPTARGRVPALPNFGGYPVFMPSLHPLTQNDQI